MYWFIGHGPVILWVCPVMFGTRIFAAESLVLCGMLLCIPMTLDKKFVAAIILGVLFLNSFVCVCVCLRARARVCSAGGESSNQSAMSLGCLVDNIKNWSR